MSTEHRHGVKNGSHGQDMLIDGVLLRVPYKLLQLVSKVKGLRSAHERVEKSLEKYIHPWRVSGRASSMMTLVELTFGQDPM